MKRRNFLLTTLAASPLLFGARLPKPLLRTGLPYKVKAGESRNGERYLMKGVTSNSLDLKIGSADTDGMLTVFEQTGSASKGGPPMHIHPEQDESFYILEGEYVFKVGNERFDMKAGDTIFLPRGVAHAFIQMTERAKVLISYQPSGKIEAFFKTTAAWTSPPSQAEITKVFEDHGMLVVGPPIKLD